jgi:hypothetical protein
MTHESECHREEKKSEHHDVLKVDKFLKFYEGMWIVRRGPIENSKM